MAATPAAHTILAAMPLPAGNRFVRGCGSQESRDSARQPRELAIAVREYTTLW